MIVIFNDIPQLSKLLAQGDALYHVILDFVAEGGKPGGKIKRITSEQHQHRYQIDDDRLIPTADFVQFIGHPKVDVQYVNAHIYAPISILQEQVPSWLHGSEKEVEGEMVPKTFAEWGTDEGIMT